MATLYELDKEFKELLSKIEDSIDMETGETKKGYDEALNTALVIQKNIATKKNNIVKLYKEIDLRLPAIDKEIERLTKMKKAYKNITDNILYVVDRYMQENGYDEIETPYGKFKYRNSTSVEIPDIAKLDQKYVKIDTKYTPDKRAIANAIKDGEEVVGASLKENKTLKLK